MKNLMENKNPSVNWRHISLAYVGLLALSLIDNGRGPVYPSILKELSITTTAGSYLFSIPSFVALFINYSTKWWYPFIGKVRGTNLGLIIMGLGSLIIAVSGYKNSYPLLLVGATGIGIGFSITAVTMNFLISGAPHTIRRKLFSGLHSVYGLGSLLAPLTLNGVLFLGLPWPVFFVTLGFFPFLIIIAHLRKEKNVEERSNEVLIAPIHFGKRAIIGLTFAFYVSFEVVISSRMVLLLQETRNFTQAEAGNYLSLFFFFLLAGRAFFAFYTTSLKTPFLLKSALISSLIFFFIGYYYHPFALSFLGLSMSLFFPMCIDWVSESFEVGKELMIASIMTTTGVILTIMHGVFGLLADSHGTNTAILLAPLFGLSSLILLFLSESIISKYNS